MAILSDARQNSPRNVRWQQMNIYTFDFDEIESQEDFIVTLAKPLVWRKIRYAISTTMGYVNERCPAATT